MFRAREGVVVVLSGSFGGGEALFPAFVVEMGGLHVKTRLK